MAIVSFLPAERCYWNLWSWKMEPWGWTLGPGNLITGGLAGSRVRVFVPWGGSPLTKRGENACGPKLFPYSPGPRQV